MDKLQLVTFNVRGLKNKRKRLSVFKSLKAEKYDVVCLQETYITTNQEAHTWELQWGGKLFYSLGTCHSRGQIILVAKKWKENVQCLYKDSRILILEMAVANKKIIIANIYAPQTTTEKTQFYTHLQTTIGNLNREDNHLVIVGDFNTVMHNTQDIITGEHHNKKEVETLNQLTTDLDLHDSWRTLHPENKDYTWSRNQPFTARRIDYIFISSSLIPYMEQSNIVSFAHSDHRAVCTSLAFHNYKRGPSYWKFNNSLLKDTQYTDQINKTIIDFSQCHNHLNPHAKWELCKIKIQEASLSYSKQKQLNKRNKAKEIQEKLTHMESKLAMDAGNTELKTEIVRLKTELELHNFASAQGAQVRARIKFIEEGEKNTAYFLRLEKHNASNNTITMIETEDGSTLTNQHEVLAQQVHFYSNLYKKDQTLDTDNTSITNFLGQDGTIPKLNAQEKQNCEGQITENEVGEALKTMKNGSAPGSDGLTTEFYKFFWNKIRTMLISSYTYSFANGHVSQSQQRGILKLIHKGQNLPREKLNNWRPITLLNTDYKILAKTLARRLNTVLDTLISDDQCGFIKGRNIASILRTTDDVINYLGNKNLPGILVGIDFAKAFDTISKTFIQNSLKHYGFGENFNKWIGTLLNETVSCINHYGWISEPFKVERGIRQGCPLSPLLFILAVELLAIKVRQSDIKGISIPNTTTGSETLETIIKIQQFADDTTLFLKDKEDLDTAMQIFHDFKTISGLKMNTLKSQAMWLGRDKYRKDKYHNLKWTLQIKILGIFFRNNTSAQNIEDNWTKKVENIKRTIKQWSKRNLSIYGKVLIAKTFLISQFVYVMQSVGLPEDVLSEINRILFAFLWKSKYNNKKAFEKVKRKVVSQNIHEGGLNMLDMRTFQEALYLTWIPKLIVGKGDSKWKVFPSLFLSSLGGNGLAILHTLCHSKDIVGIPQHGGNFWQNVLKSWLNLRMKTAKDFNEDGPKTSHPNSSLWNNPNLQYKQKHLHMKDWIANGIHRVQDVLNDRNELISFPELEDRIGKAPHHLFEYNAVQTAFNNALDRGKLLLYEEEDLDLANIAIGIRPVQTLKSKDFRQLLGDSILPCSTQFWNRKLSTNINQAHWNAVFQATTETRLRVLHWKILHNIYPTNILLFKMGIADSNKCNACPSGEKDFIEHFFFHCATVKPVWTRVEQEINARTGSYLKITEPIALLGYQDKSFTNHTRNIINSLIIIAKMCISKYRYGDRLHIDLIFERELLLRCSQKPFRATEQ